MAAHNRQDLTGMRFGLLTAVAYSRRVVGGSKWICRCACGSTREYYATHLKRGATRSCGCQHDKAISDAKKVHGLTGTRTHRIWSQMLARCDRESAPAYPLYGGRGIAVCERWRDFRNFLADMGFAPDGLQLDRMNNNGNYEPSNCRWATPKEQANNRRSNVIVVFESRRMTLAQLSDLVQMPAYKLKRHIKSGRFLGATFA